jgi:hypothetical protein
VPEAFAAHCFSPFLGATAADSLAPARVDFYDPNRIAVVQVGTRPGPGGIETFINVERLQPSEDQN